MHGDDHLFTHTIWDEPLDPPFHADGVAAGSFDSRVLDQDQQWVDVQGQAHLLVDLDPAWRRNIVAFLHLKARSLHRVWALCEVLGLSDSAAAYLAMLDSGAPMIGDTDAAAWLESTPLVRALRQLQPDIASPAVLHAWAEAAHDALRRDPDAAIMLPQDPTRRWNE